MRRWRSADRVLSVSAQSAARAGRFFAKAFVEGSVGRAGGRQLLLWLCCDELVVSLLVPLCLLRRLGRGREPAGEFLDQLRDGVGLLGVVGKCSRDLLQTRRAGLQAGRVRRHGRSRVTRPRRHRGRPRIGIPRHEGGRPVLPAATSRCALSVASSQRPSRALPPARRARCAARRSFVRWPSRGPIAGGRRRGADRPSRDARQSAPGPRA